MEPKQKFLYAVTHKTDLSIADQRPLATLCTFSYRLLLSYSRNLLRTPLAKGGASLPTYPLDVQCPRDRSPHRRGTSLVDAFLSTELAEEPQLAD